MRGDVLPAYLPPLVVSMSLPTDVRLVRSECFTQEIEYRAPLKFGGRLVTDVVLMNVEVEVESRTGLRGVGRGSMPLGNIWAWPTDSASPGQTLTAMQRLAEDLVHRAGACPEYAHPLALTTLLAADQENAARGACAQTHVAEPMPRLAQLVAASPLEAAIHDAFARAHGVNAYNALGPDYLDRDLGDFLGDEFAGEHLDRYTLRKPKPRMPLYHLVGAVDPLTDADVGERIGDGLPETLPEWIAADGLTHLKIKLSGDDLAWDVKRVVSVDRIACDAQAARGCDSWNYSADFNERCENVDYVLAFMAQVEEQSPAAFERIQYLEQPTHRDLKAHPENRMHAAAAIKPVVIDESLVDFESLSIAREQGYSGVALKACKGHTEALLMGAAAQKFGLFLCVQDLTCPGASFLHSASLSARIPTVAAIEGNARQYCPAGNDGWAERYAGMFHVADGTLETALLDEVGLGFAWPAGAV